MNSVEDTNRVLGHVVYHGYGSTYYYTGDEKAPWSIHAADAKMYDAKTFPSTIPSLLGGYLLERSEVYEDGMPLNYTPSERYMTYYNKCVRVGAIPDESLINFEHQSFYTVRT